MMLSSSVQSRTAMLRKWQAHSNILKGMCSELLCSFSFEEIDCIQTSPFLNVRIQSLGDRKLFIGAENKIGPAMQV